MPKITVDLSDWELADWPGELAQGVEVFREVVDGAIEVTLKFDGIPFEAITRKIIKEGIETFLEGGGTVAVIKKGGISLSASEIGGGEEVVVLPWKHEAWKAFLDADPEMIGEMFEFLREQCKELGIEPPWMEVLLGTESEE